DSLGPRGVADRCTSRGYPEQAFDAYAALRYLTQQFFVDATRIAVLGQSMGGIATLYAVDRDMAAIFYRALSGCDRLLPGLPSPKGVVDRADPNPHRRER